MGRQRGGGEKRESRDRGGRTVGDPDPPLQEETHPPTCPECRGCNSQLSPSLRFASWSTPRPGSGDKGPALLPHPVGGSAEPHGEVSLHAVLLASFPAAWPEACSSRLQSRPPGKPLLCERRFLEVDLCPDEREG